MLKLAVALLIVSAVIAVLAVVPALGIGGRILPGYFFHARGKEARLREKKLLRIVACLLWTVSAFIAAAGVMSYFAYTDKAAADEKHAIIIIAVTGLIVTALWAIYFIKGDMRKLAKEAKELSE